MGFLSIYVIARIYQGASHWWPLIPGVVLVIIGLPRTARIFRFLLDNWPVILIAIGAVVIIAAFRRPPAAAPPAARPEEPVEPEID